MLTQSISRICVYCGSSEYVDERYREVAKRVGQQLAEMSIELVYGGGNVGLMRCIADGVLEAGGSVIGVIPEHLKNLELAHPGIQTLYTTQSMHQRKFLMAQLADAFIALPGGFGTLEELAEAATWTQLNIHDKPVGVINTNGFFNGLLSWVRHASKEGFIRPAHQQLICSADSLEELLIQFTQARYTPLVESL